MAQLWKRKSFKASPNNQAEACQTVNKYMFEVAKRRGENPTKIVNASWAMSSSNLGINSGTLRANL
jgi:hypothetical protein